MNARILHLLAATALAITVLASVIPARAQTSLPDLGDVSSATLSETQEKTIGNRIMREIRIDPLYVDDPDVTDYIRALGARLLLSSDGPRRDIAFFVVQDDSINAFALVGGHIGIHTGLLSLSNNEGELAGVVAHEIAHITQRHQARALHGQRTSQWTSLAALALAILAARGNSSQSGQMTEAALASASAIAIQSQLDYTREHEREADRVGLSILEKAGLDTRGMQGFFERMLRANRLNEFKSSPSYLRTHPLTTERIADMQDRIERLPNRMVPDSFDYRLARAKVRAMAGTPTEAANTFRALLEDRTVVRPREDVYGLAVSQRRTRDFEGAWKTLAPLRAGTATPHPAFELLAGQLQADLGRTEEALAIYTAAEKSLPPHRGITYARLEVMIDRGRSKEVLADLQERLRHSSDDPRLYELQARAFESGGRRGPQHRAQAEAFYRRGNLAAAVEQLELALKTKGADFYESSSVEARLQELRTLLENERAAEKALKIS